MSCPQQTFGNRPRSLDISPKHCNRVRLGEPMLFRMAFKITDDNYLQVKAFAKGIQNLSAVHLNPEVFSTAVKIAGIPEPTSSELEAAAREAYLRGGLDVCCEQVELNRPQLEVLRLVSAEGEPPNYDSLPSVAL
jgi:hypothetical protein